MKTLSSFLLMTALAAPGAWAQTPPAAPEQALIAVENEWSQAAVKRDGAALARCADLLQELRSVKPLFEPVEAMIRAKVHFLPRVRPIQARV